VDDNVRVRIREVPPILTRKELADLLHITERQVDRLVKDGVLPVIYIRSSVRFHAETILNMMGDSQVYCEKPNL